ncbi:MAG: CcmD family protein [Ignavibacteria bacterium]|jgi:CcmD family protein|nr:CcmD family protein [Ignavibacteria bacterium]
MLEEFLSKNAIYIVMIIVLIVWAGVFGFLFALNNRIKHIEKEIEGDKGK